MAIVWPSGGVKLPAALYVHLGLDQAFQSGDDVEQFVVTGDDFVAIHSEENDAAFGSGAGRVVAVNAEIGTALSVMTQWRQSEGQGTVAAGMAAGLPQAARTWLWVFYCLVLGIVTIKILTGGVFLR